MGGYIPNLNYVGECYISGAGVATLETLDKVTVNQATICYFTEIGLKVQKPSKYEVWIVQRR